MGPIPIMSSPSSALVRQTASTFLEEADGPSCVAGVCRAIPNGQNHPQVGCTIIQLPDVAPNQEQLKSQSNIIINFATTTALQLRSTFPKPRASCGVHRSFWQGFSLACCLVPLLHTKNVLTSNQISGCVKSIKRPPTARDMYPSTGHAGLQQQAQSDDLVLLRILDLGQPLVGEPMAPKNWDPHNQ